MRALLPVTLIAAIASTAALAGPVARESGAQKVALGLKAPAGDSVWRANEDADKLQLRNNGLSYGGVRETPRLGLYSIESYGGVFRPLTENWGSTVEAGVARDTPFALSRYSVTGQLHTALAPRHGLSLGLKFSTAERSSFSTPPATRIDPASAADLLTERWSGGASYEFQLSYLYGARYSVGISYQLGNAGNYYSPYGLNPSPRAFALSSQYWLSSNWAMSYDVSAPEPGALLQSPNFGLGLRYRF
jgi:hypothetical protein